MIAIIETSGKQYKVEKGSVIQVDKLDLEPGATFTVNKVLLISADGKTEVGTPSLKATVTLKVVDHRSGEKLHVFKMKAKKRYQKTIGHRQDYTDVEVMEIKN